MKKLSSIIFICVLIYIQPNISQAQLNISLGPAIGYTIPSADYGGNPSDYYLGNKYGLKSAINFGAMGKLGIGPLGFNLSILYTPMSNSGVADPNHPNSSVDISQHLLTIGIGSHFGFGVPLAPVVPYVGLDILISSLSGSATFHNPPSSVPTGTVDMSTATRTGLGINGGVEIKLMSTKVDLSLRYNMINLFSKSYDGAPGGNRIEAYKYLNDYKDPNYSTDPNGKDPIGSNRVISTIQFELGVMFGL